MTPEQAREVRDLEHAMLAAWDARRDTVWMADFFGMDEGDVAAMLARLLEERREVRGAIPVRSRAAPAVGRPLVLARPPA